MHLLNINLHLLDEQLGRMAETPYFSPRLNDVLARIREVASVLQSALNATPSTMNDEVARRLVSWIWRNTQYLAGSTNKRIPYEVVYALERAASTWLSRDMVITTALLKSSEFHVRGLDLATRELIEQEMGVKLGAEIVQCALPEIYRHRPLYCVALYHELGHFVDFQHGITPTTLLKSSALDSPYPPGLLENYSGVLEKDPEAWLEYVRSHRMEYFADLFFACYVGEAAIHFLEAFAPSHKISPTHPATSDRIQVMRDFLDGKGNQVVSLFQAALAARGLPLLTLQFDVPDISHTFGNVRPYRICSDRELHGMFLAGWEFLRRIPNGRLALWDGLSSPDVERMANDLTEKSVRSYMVERGWNAAAS